MDTKEKVFIAILIAGILILGGTGIYTVMQEKELLLSTRMASEEYQHIQRMDSFSDALRDLRREGFYYTIYQDDSYRKNFNQQVTLLDDRITAIRNEQQRLIQRDDFEPLLAQAQAYADDWQELIRLAQTQEPRAQILEAAQTQSAALDALLNKILEMTQQSFLIYTQENNKNIETVRQAMLAVTLFTVLALLLIIVAVVALLRYYQLNRKLLAQTVQLKDILQAKNGDMEMIISVVSHDLRAPLINIKGFSKELGEAHQTLNDLLAEMPGRREHADPIDPILHRHIPEALGFIENGIETMDRLIDNLIQVVRAGQLPTNPVPLGVNQLVAEILKDFEYRIQQDDARITVEPLPACRADRDQIRQVFSNLIDNALKYRDPGRPLHIRIAGQTWNRQSTYAVEDNGIGIAPGDVEKVFSMFQRLKEHGIKGEGLGLALARRMAERNGGTLDVQSEPGKGSRFTLRLPAAD